MLKNLYFNNNFINYSSYVVVQQKCWGIIMAQEKTKNVDAQSNDHSKICAILAYFFPIGLIWYLVDENLTKDSLAAYHVHQSLVLVITALIISAVGAIIPFIGWFIILPLGNLFVLVLFIIGIINAAKEEKKELPVIGKFAKSFKF